MTEDRIYYSLEEFFAELDRLMAPVYALADLKEEHREELKEIGIVKENPQPKWARRKKGEKRPSDRWDYGEKT